jgi:hypothetical protein
LRSSQIINHAASGGTAALPGKYRTGFCLGISADI